MGPFQFQQFWNSLQENFLVVSEVHTEKTQVLLKIDTDSFHSPDSLSVTVDELKKGIIVESQLIPVKSNAVAEGEGDRAVSVEARIRGGRARFGVHADVVVPIDFKAVGSPSTYCDLYPRFVRIGCRPFNEVFPELDEVIKEYPRDVSANSARSFLTLEKFRSSSAVTLAGVSVPRARVVIAGSLVLFAIGLYMASHLHALRLFAQTLEAPPLLPEVPWIGLFRGPVALFVALGGACLLPLGAALRLGFIAADSENSWYVWLGTAVLALVSLWVGYQLTRLRIEWFSSMDGKGS